MPIILYINEEHCTSVEQLRSYFEETIDSIFYDIIDYARSGDMSSWLREKGESDLADKVDSIDENLGDSEYFSRLSALMTGKETASDSFEKPDFSKCFQVEEARLEESSGGMKVQVRLKVLSSVNETYELAVRTSWGIKGDEVNPFQEEKGGILTKSFIFRKRPSLDFKDVVLLADGKELKDVQCAGLGGAVLEFEVDSCRFKMIPIEHGTFMMGATSPVYDERPVHEVTLTNDYYIGETQVTQALWTAVMEQNPSCFKGDDLPVENVSWNACKTFIKRLNKLLSEKLGKKCFALPTEAQWEFAARGGNKSKHTRYSGSNNIKEVAWYDRNSDKKTQLVKTKKANELGIYDMSGNVWEWCQDWYGDYSSNAQTNPTGPSSGTYRVYRGGSWDNDASSCRLPCRGLGFPNEHGERLGLRLVLSE